MSKLKDYAESITELTNECAMKGYKMLLIQERTMRNMGLEPDNEAGWLSEYIEDTNRYNALTKASRKVIAMRITSYLTENNLLIKEAIRRRGG